MAQAGSGPAKSRAIADEAGLGPAKSRTMAQAALGPAKSRTAMPDLRGYRAG